MALKFTLKAFNGTRHDLVEDVVGSFKRLLRDDPGLLEQICKHANHLEQLQSVNGKTYKFQYRHRPVYQWDRSGYG